MNDLVQDKTISNADKFYQDLKRLDKAVIGVIMVRTREWFRAVNQIRHYCTANNRKFNLWTICRGTETIANDDPTVPLLQYADGKIQTDSVYDVARAWEQWLDNGAADREKINNAKPRCLVIADSQFAFDNNLVQQLIKNQVQKSLDTEDLVIMVVPECAEIPPEIEDDITLLDLLPPAFVELRAQLDASIEQAKYALTAVKVDPAHFFALIDDEAKDVIAQNGLGMSLQEFDNALAFAWVDTSPNGNDSRDVQITKEAILQRVLSTKLSVLKKTDLLELMPTAKMEDVGGLDLLKEYLYKRKRAFSKEARAFGVDMPKGILLAGVPGTGKSLVAKAVSAVFEIPLIRFDIGKVFGQYVGQSESRMRSALKMIDASAPLVLMLDEIDKGLSGTSGGGDSGTTSRVFGTLLTWMQEREAKGTPVFVVATANNVSGLPPEPLRKGRFDEIFSVGFPTVDERSDILKIHLKKRNHEEDLSDEEIYEIAEVTDRWSGAELESLISTSVIEAFNEQSQKLTKEIVLAQAKLVNPLSKAFPEKVTAMEQWAKQNARATSSGKAKAKNSNPSTENVATIRRLRLGNMTNKKNVNWGE